MNRMRLSILPICIAFIASCATDATGEFFVNVKDALVVRAEPNVKAKALANLPPNSKVIVVRYDKQTFTLDGESGKYAYVAFNLKGKDKFGYVFSPFLRQTTIRPIPIIVISALSLLAIGVAVYFRKSLIVLSKRLARTIVALCRKTWTAIFIDLPNAIREHRRTNPPAKKPESLKEPVPAKPAPEKVVVINKSGFGSIGFVLIVVIALAATRPNINDFEIFLKNQIRQQIQKSSDLVRAGNTVIGLFGVDVSQFSTNALIANTREESLLIFSIFEFRDVDNRRHRYLGIAKNFVALPP